MSDMFDLVKPEDLLRVYLDPAEIAPEGHAHAGYPWVWFRQLVIPQPGYEGRVKQIVNPIKDLIRDRDGHRCLRCHHPYVKGAGEWSACDEQCTHGGPIRAHDGVESTGMIGAPTPESEVAKVIVHARNERWAIEAAWRILTVHHLNGVKHDCRWWNLVSLCQRCHLEIQAKVHMQRRYRHEHSEWFKPFVAGYYAWAFLGLDLTETETRTRLDELLGLEDRQLAIEEA